MSVTAKNAKETARLIRESAERLENEILELKDSDHPTEVALRKKKEAEFEVMRDIHSSLNGMHSILANRAK